MILRLGGDLQADCKKLLCWANGLIWAILVGKKGNKDNGGENQWPMVAKNHWNAVGELQG